MIERVTLVFTDLLDSTATNVRLGDAAMADLWIEHDRGARELMRRLRGREIDRSDGYLLLFSDPCDAAAFTSEYHRMLATLAVPMMARAAIHVGEVELRRNSIDDINQGAKSLEVFGLAKAYCARLMGIAHGAQTLATASAAEALAGSGWRCLFHGHWRLKGLSDPVELFEIGDDDAPFIPPAEGEKATRVARVDGQWVGLRDVPRQLPAEPPGLVGRQAEQRELADRFATGARVVTLSGTGGIGKTRLALRYGWSWLGDYPGGVYFCDLSRAHDAEGIVHAVAAALQLPPSGDQLAQVGRAIQGRGRCLVILDNFEQVAAHGTATLGRWLDAAQQSAFIVTSRERLGVVGEQVLALEPLEPDAAIELFHTRARAACGTYDSERPKSSTMHSLVALLDGLPLAIELAAARVTVLDPDELLARMGQRFLLLSSADVQRGRHSTLRTTLDWSWDLLTSAERSVLAQTSVFEGGFNLDAAEAVLATDSAAVWKVDLLQALVDKSLIRPSVFGRFGLLRSIQEFAAEKRAEFQSGGEPAGDASSRHRRYYAGLDEARATSGRGVELGNLGAACRSAMLEGDVQCAVSCLRLTWAVLRLTGPFLLGAELALQVKAMPGLNGVERAETEWVLATAYKALGRLDDARTAVTQAIAITPEAADSLRARVQCTFGELLGLAGEVSAAEIWLVKARASAERGTDAGIGCNVLSALGTLYAENGRSGLAREAYEEAIVVAVRAGERRWQGGVLGNLGVLLMNAGRYDEAEAACSEALLIARECGDRRWEGNALCNLGFIYLQQRALDHAESELEQALVLARHMGHRTLEITALCNLGLVSDARGDSLAASVRHREAVEGAEHIGDARTEAQFRTCLGASLARAGQQGEAHTCLERAIELARRTEDESVIGLALCSMAEAHYLAGAVHLADAAVREAARLADSSRQPLESELVMRVHEVRLLSRG